MTLSEVRLPSIHELHPKMMVSENVRLVRQIGEGGMGSVWLADHLGLDAQVAVKFMSPALACHPAAVERFTREAKAAAHIRHPHVVQIFDSGAQSHVAGGLPYMVMEYLEGEDLETRLHTRGRLSLDDVATIVLQTSRALDKAHELGVVHRDIKPENIFLCEGNGDEPFVKVLDFGIAKTANDGNIRVTNTGATLGTPNYMSPEQMLSAKNVDYHCDLWALAVVAYYAITGKLPFEGETYGAICLAVNRGRFRLPSRIRKSVPDAIDAWFRCALARQPENRFASARELGEAFVAAVDGVPARLRRKTTPFSARATLMGATVTRSGVHTQRRSRLVPFVALPALAVGALAAVLVVRPDWRVSLDQAAHAAPAQVTSLRSATLSTHRKPELPPAAATIAPAPTALVPEVATSPTVLRPIETVPATAAPTTAPPIVAAKVVPKTQARRHRHAADFAPVAPAATTAPDDTTSAEPYGPETPIIVPLPPAVPSGPEPSGSGPGA